MGEDINRLQRVKSLGWQMGNTAEDNVIFSSRSNQFKVGECVVLGGYICKIESRKRCGEKRRYAFHFTPGRKLTHEEFASMLRYWHAQKGAV